MKKILKYTLFAALALVVAGCAKKELDTNPYGDGVRFAAMSPNPVMRGGELRILGSNLDQVSEIRFAGDVTVTDFQVVSAGKTGELRVVVPLEGPLVGPVTLVGKDGVVRKSFSDLTFTEPIEINFFSPVLAVSREVITFKGEYLNVVKTVIFAGDVMVNEFVSQSRHELKVAVPFNATTGPVILSDVDEINDQATIPNHIYTSGDLEIGTPVVSAFPAPKSVKAGEKVSVGGEHLDMIKKVDLPNAEDISFEVDEAATVLSFVMPAEAQSGDLLLTTYDGDVFDAGEIEATVVDFLAIRTLAEDKRFKAGCEVEITGFDLDLVTEVSFPNAQLVAWDYDEETGSIFLELPADTRDGAVTVTMASGVQVSTDPIEVVKPEILAWEHFDTYVAGETVVTVDGTDLDLVDTVLMGDDKQGYFECYHDYDAENGTVKVTIPEEAYTSPIIFISAAKYTTQTDPLEVGYKLPVSITFDAPSFSMGKTLSLTGSNLLKIEQVYIKGQKVTDFAVRADDAMSFTLPEKVGPGVYRLELAFTDGTKLTWPVPFEVTAPYTETFFWQGEIDLSGGAQPYLGADGALAGSLAVGDLIRVYFTAPADGWWFEIYGGHWDGLLLKPTPETYDPSAGYCVFEVTEANIGTLTNVGGWGGVLVVQGSVTVTGASVIHFGAAETVIYEGPTSMTWGDDGRFGLALKYFEDAGAGATMTIYFKQTENWGQVQINDGWWSNSDMNFPELGGAYLTTDNAGGKDVTKIALTITGDMLEHLKSHAGDYFGLNTQYQGDGRVGMVLQGSDWIIEQITIM